MTKQKFTRYIIIAFCIFTFSTILICNLTSKDKSNRTQKDFLEFTNSIFTSELSANAFNLHFYLKNPSLYGINDAPPIIGSLNYEEMADSESYYLNYINALKKYNYNDLSDDEQLTYDILMHHLQTELDFPDMCLNYELLSPTIGVQAQLPVLLSQYTFNDEYDVATYIKILQSVPQYFKEILAFEKIKAENGTFMSNQTLEDVVQQCSNFANSDDNFLIETFYERIKDLPQISNKKKEAYIESNELAVKKYLIPAYQALIDGLNSLKGSCKNSLGLCYNENGKNYYRYLVQSYTGSSRTVPEIEKLIQTKMKEDLSVLSALTGDASVYNAIIKAEKEPTSDSPEAILKKLINKIEDDFPKAASTNYTVNYVPESLEEHLSPAFYLSPPIDDSDNNRIFINNNEDFSGDNLFVTLAHEGYPGHLYQATYFNSKNPPLIRHLLDFGGYTEGWATYVEFYSYSYKYDDPKVAKALSSSASYSLALYCLADIGINYHGWNLEETCEFLTAHGIDDKSVATEIFNRMIAEPANYLQYYVGYLEFLELKKQMQELRGDDFSILEFHTYILDMGPAPFEILSKYMK